VGVRNVLEGLAAQEYERLLPDVKNFCGCPACRDDVLVYALNRLPPLYVTTHHGGVLGQFQREKREETTRAAVILLDAFERVRAKPSQGCETLTDK